MPIETFANFPIKTTPLSGDFLVGYDTAGEIRTTLSNIINAVVPQVLAAVPTIPIGTIITYGSSTTPTGWFPCDGRLLSTTEYANLYSVIGNTYGSGIGTFNLPDLRGYFVRGWDNNRGIDIIDGTYSQSARAVTITTNTPHGLTTGNVATLTYTTGTGVNGTFAVTVTNSTVFTYTAVASQTASGNVVLTGLSHLFGQTENDGIGSHNHTITDPGHNHSVTDPGHKHSGIPIAPSNLQKNIAPGTSVYDINLNRAGLTSSNTTGITINSGATGITINSSGTSLETRPKNIALLYCIKY